MSVALAGYLTLHTDPWRRGTLAACLLCDGCCQASKPFPPSRELYGWIIGHVTMCIDTIRRVSGRKSVRTSYDGLHATSS